MLITLSSRTAICQSVAKFLLIGVAPLEAVSHRLNLFFNEKEIVSEIMVLSSLPRSVMNLQLEGGLQFIDELASCAD